MTLTASPDTIAAIWSALTTLDCKPSPATRSCRHQTADILRETAATGWTGVLETETVLLAAGIGVPAGSMADTLAMFGIAPQWVYRRPKAETTAALSIQRVAAVDLAHLLVLVERAGFPVDPGPLCQALVPTLRTRAYLTGPEVAVHWHARERHRVEPLLFSTVSDRVGGISGLSTCTPTGYRADLSCSPAGEPRAIRITAPKWRPSRRTLAA